MKKNFIFKKVKKIFVILKRIARDVKFLIEKQLKRWTKKDCLMVRPAVRKANKTKEKESKKWGYGPL